MKAGSVACYTATLRLLLDYGDVDERRVFPGCTPGAVQAMIDRACKAAGIAHFTPHDLRHRRLTRWHH